MDGEILRRSIQNHNVLSQGWVDEGHHRILWRQAKRHKPQSAMHARDGRVIPRGERTTLHERGSNDAHPQTRFREADGAACRLRSRKGTSGDQSASQGREQMRHLPRLQKLILQRTGVINAQRRLTQMIPQTLQSMCGHRVRAVVVHLARLAVSDADRDDLKAIHQGNHAAPATRLLAHVCAGPIDRIQSEVQVALRNRTRDAQTVLFTNDPKVREAFLDQLHQVVLARPIHLRHPVDAPTSFHAFGFRLSLMHELQGLHHRATTELAHRISHQVGVVQISHMHLQEKGREKTLTRATLHVNMDTLIFATQNTGKLTEMRQLLDGFGITVKSAQEAGVTEDIIEDGETFAANALKKARFVVKQTGEWAVADDSGITIDALDGRPGVYTARWAGEGASDEQLVRHTLNQLKHTPEGERNATFHTVLALVSPEGEERLFEGVIDGIIPIEPRGMNRPKLPYDLIFQPNEYEQTFAQMSDAQKNQLSHRGKAFAKLKQYLAETVKTA